MILMLCVGGCVTGSTQFVREGEPVILAEAVHATVFYQDPNTKKLVKSKGKVKLQPGWVVIPPFAPAMELLPR